MGCIGMCGPKGYGFSAILVINRVWKEEKSVFLNTEEMLAGFTKLNDSHVTEDIVVGSADVKALYPSLDISFTVEMVCEVFHTSGVKVVGLNAEELGLYLSLNRSEAELRDQGLLRFRPRRKTNRGRSPTITGCAVDENKTKRFQPWLPPVEQPDEVTTRKMFTEAMKIVLLFIMQNNLYTFDNEIKLQSDGGPIGQELTGVLAQLFMVWWDRQMVKKLEESGMELRMYKRYVDDINVIMNASAAGLRFEEGNVIQDENFAQIEQNLEPDKRCILLFQSTGNSIHPFVRLEVDYPSRHEDGKLPILDLKVWIEKRTRVGDGGQGRDVQVVLHEFYYKDVASKSVINARSALPWGCKRTILTQEVLRILLNCSRELPWKAIVAHVNHMMLRLQYSGYDRKFREEVVRSTLAAYDRLVELDANGEKPLYRPREWRALERERERRKRHDNWFRKGDFDTVVFVPATPGSQLKRRYMREIKATEFKIKVVEQSGTTLKAMLQRSDPFKQS